jgi:hypothetical protein
VEGPRERRGNPGHGRGREMEEKDKKRSKTP